MRNKDIPLTPESVGRIRSTRRPETPIEALMMAGSRDVVEESVEELQPIREAVADCIELLSPQDQFIVDALNSEMISLEELGSRLGVTKTHAWRLRNAAYARLQLHLQKHPIIRERLGFDDETDYSGI